MEITKADLEARLEELRKAQEQRISDANALGGAIQDCQFWLSRLSAPVPEEPKSNVLQFPKE